MHRHTIAEPGLWRSKLGSYRLFRLKLQKRALITGITGQDVSYLTELLLGKGYEVHGIIHRASTFNTELAWEPRIKFKELVRIMVDADAEAIGATPKGAGRRILEEKFGDWHQWTGSVSKCLEAAAGTALGD